MAPDMGAAVISFNLYDNPAENGGHAFATNTRGCQGIGDFKVYGPGYTADLLSNTGAILDSAKVEPGRIVRLVGAKVPACRFTFTFTDLPLTTDLVRLKLGGQESPVLRSADIFSAEGVSLGLNEVTP